MTNHTQEDIRTSKHLLLYGSIITFLLTVLPVIYKMIQDIGMRQPSYIVDWGHPVIWAIIVLMYTMLGIFIGISLNMNTETTPKHD